MPGLRDLSTKELLQLHQETTGSKLSNISTDELLRLRDSFVQKRPEVPLPGQMGQETGPIGLTAQEAPVSRSQGVSLPPTSEPVESLNYPTGAGNMRFSPPEQIPLSTGVNYPIDQAPVILPETPTQAMRLQPPVSQPLTTSTNGIQQGTLEAAYAQQPQIRENPAGPMDVAKGLAGGFALGAMPVGVEPKPYGSVMERLAYSNQNQPGSELGQLAGGALPVIASLGAAGSIPMMSKIPTLARIPLEGLIAGGMMNTARQAGEIGTPEFNPKDVGKEALTFAALNSILGGAGYATKSLPQLAQIASEIGAFGTASPVLEGRKPTLKDYGQAGLIVGGMRGIGKLGDVLSRPKRPLPERPQRVVPLESPPQMATGEVKPQGKKFDITPMKAQEYLKGVSRETIKPQEVKGNIVNDYLAKISSSSPLAKKKLESMGFAVKELKNGNFEINGDISKLHENNISTEHEIKGNKSKHIISSSEFPNIIKIKQEVKNDSEAQRRLLRQEREGKKPGGTVQKPTAGGKKTKAGGILQTQEVKPPPMATEFKEPPKKTLTTGEPRTIALNKAEIKAIREGLSLKPLSKPKKRRMIQVLDEAKRDNMASKAIENAEQALNSGKLLTDKEHAGMILKAIELKDEYENKVKEADKLFKEGNKGAGELARQQSESLLDNLDLLTRGNDAAGTSLSRAFSIRRMRINTETYDLATIMTRARVAKGGRLSEEQTKRIEKIVKKYKESEKKYDDMMARYDELMAENEKLKAENIAKIEASKAKYLKKTKKAKEINKKDRENIKKQLVAMGFKVHEITGLTVEGSYLIGKLAVTYIKEGTYNLRDLVKKVKSDIPELTDVDVYKALNTRDPKRQDRARKEVTKKVSLIKRQAKLMLDIEKAEKGIFEKPKKRPPKPAEIKELQNKLTQLRALAYETVPDPLKLERALKTLGELQDQLDNNYRILKKAKRKVPPELSSLHEKIKYLRRMMDIKDELADLNRQLETGDFKIKEPTLPKPKTPEMERAEIELIRARRAVKQAIESMKPMTLRRATSKIVNTLRTTKATADMSAVLRQGLILSVQRPGIAGKAYTKSIKAMFSEYTSEQIDNNMRSQPQHYIREKSGLHLSEIGSSNITAREEYFMSNVLDKIPVVKTIVNASERHMTTFLNQIRVGAFDDFLARHPNATHAELKAWADWINVATGRGNMKPGTAEALGNILFAPRFAASRIQTPFMLYKYWKEPRVRKEIAKDYAATGSLALTTLALAKMGGADVEVDPESPDFGKIRFGDTRVDIFAGIQQPMRVLARIGFGAVRKDIDVEPLDIIGRFAAYKLGPGVTIPYQLYTGKSIIGERMTPTETAVRQVIPMVFEDIYDAYKSGGISLAAKVAPGVIHGMNINTYMDSRRQTIKNIIKHEESGEYKKANELVKKWNSSHDDRKDKLKPAGIIYRNHLRSKRRKKRDGK